MRAVILAAAAAVLVSGQPAPAAPAQRICRHVGDPEGDVTTVESMRPPGVTPDPSIDIVSADLGVDARYVTAVVRFDDLSDRALDRRWDRFSFRAGGHTFEFEVLRWYPTAPPSTDTVSFSHVDQSQKTVLTVPAYTYDASADELRMSVPVATTNAYVRIAKGTKVGSFTVVAERSYSVAVHEVFDDAENSRSWTVGTPSCVRPGP